MDTYTIKSHYECSLKLESGPPRVVDLKFALVLTESGRRLASIQSDDGPIRVLSGNSVLATLRRERHRGVVRFWIEESRMLSTCKPCLGFYRKWADKAVAYASAYLYLGGTKYAGADAVFARFCRFLDMIGLPYFLTPDVGLSFPLQRGHGTEAPNATLSAEWEIDGYRLTVDVTLEGESSYTLISPDSPTEAGKINTSDAGAVQGLFRKFMRLQNVGTPANGTLRHTDEPSFEPSK